jgi:integrase
LTWAGARDDRLQPNDADMWSQIDASLPKRSKRAAKVRNHPAVPFAQIADVMRQIRETPRATEPVKLLAQWIALTACRTKEARHATWSEIDLKARTWSIPDEKMKSGRAHRVALSDEALAVLKRAKAIAGDSPLLFPIGKQRKMISADTVLAMHHRIGYDFTVHGYRSAFRDWAYERTDYPRELIEQCIAHSVGDATELAYKRGDALDRRRALMNDWAVHITGTQS